MPRSLTILIAAFAIARFVPTLANAGPVSREVYERQSAELDRLKRQVAAETNAAVKVDLIRGALRAEPDPNARRRHLAVSNEVAAPEREVLLTGVLETDPDAGLRSEAATLLGRFGSERSLAALAKAAASDPTTDQLLGDVGDRSSAPPGGDVRDRRACVAPPGHRGGGGREVAGAAGSASAAG